MLVMLLQESQQVLHLLGSPVGERTGDHGQTVVKVRKLVCFGVALSEGIRVVTDSLGVLVSS